MTKDKLYEFAFNEITQLSSGWITDTCWDREATITEVKLALCHLLSAIDNYNTMISEITGKSLVERLEK